MSLFDGVVNDRRRAEILATGARAQGTVTGVRSLGKTSAAGYLTEISVQIDPPGGKPVSRTIREWLPPGAEARLTIGSTVPVRYDGKTVVLEATPGAAAALQQGQATWMTPPGQPSGSYLPSPGQPAMPFGTMPNVQVGGMNLGDLVNQALQSGNYTVHTTVGADPVADAPRLLASGARATATVVDVTDMSVGAMTLSLVELRVEPVGAPPYETMVNVRFSTPERRAMVSPGARVPVRYDPADPQKVVLDAPAMGISG